MKNVAAFVLAGGRVADLGVLTLRRAKSALPFAGVYRFVDFPMSNLALSGVDRVGVLSQYRLSSLMDHIRNGASWGIVGRKREVHVLSPFQGEGNVDWYRGTADAVYRNLNFLKGEDRVLIVSGDHVYHMDYNRLLEEHVRTGAHLTMAFKRFTREACRSFGTADVDSGGRVLSYQEKPASPRSDLGSLTVYLFERDVLEHYLRLAMQTGKESYHLYEDVVPQVVASGKVQSFLWDGYWAYARTVDDYFKASMDVLDPASGLDLDRWEVFTNADQAGVGDVAPAYVTALAGVEDSRLSPGCLVNGVVRRSILSPGVVVEEGAQVTECVLMHGVRVGRNCKLHRVIADKHVVIEDGCQLGHEGAAAPFAGAPQFHTCGAVLLGRESRVAAGARVGANTQVEPAAVVAAGSQVDDSSLVKRMGEEPWFARW
jgi:glucose-1-phosphate adenylyltransferase